MKKKKNKLMLGAMIASGSIFTACNINGNVYGPPPDPVQTVIPEPVYGPPAVFDPADNIPEDVYGPPPEDFSGSGTTETVSMPPFLPPETYDSENVPVCVYGPPSWFAPEENIPEDVYGPPQFFDQDQAPEEK